MEKPVRLDKFLADAGAGTRSEVKKYIQKGQVEVNGKSVKKPELKVTKEDQVVMNGQEIHAAPKVVKHKDPEQRHVSPAHGVKEILQPRHDRLVALGMQNQGHGHQGHHFKKQIDGHQVSRKA